MNAVLESVRADLGEHVEFISGFAFKSSKFNDQGEGLPIARIRDVVRGFSETFYEGEFDEKFVIKDGDYLIGMDGEFNLAKWKGGKALLNQRVCKLGDISENLDRHYLARFLPKALKDIEDVTSFVTVKHLSVKQLRQIQIPLPPLEEQKRIAGILDAADILRAKRREALAKLDDLLQSTFLDMFGDPVTNPKGWEVKELDKLGLISTGSTPPSKLDGMFDGEIPFVTPGDLKETWVNTKRSVTIAGARKSRTVNKGATFVCCIGATIGKMGKANEQSAFNQQINAVQWSCDVNNDFGFEMLKSFKGKIARDGASTTLPILKKSLFQKIRVPVPPLNLQQRFAEIVTTVEEQKAKMRKHLEQLDDLFASLQQRAFRGDL